MQAISSQNQNQTTAAALAFEGEDALSSQESALLLGALLTLGSVIATIWML